MTEMKRARVATFVAAAGYFATAGLHATGYDSVTALAGEGPADLGIVVPALWLNFSLQLVVLGLMLSAAALHPGFRGAPGVADNSSRRARKSRYKSPDCHSTKRREG